jgi:CheY-like chemotaxis protein
MSNSLLIVEDNVVEREGLATLLRREGYKVALAAGGVEGLDVLLKQKPDLILLDMVMQDGDGWRFLEQRRRYPECQEIPAILVTGLPVVCEPWADKLGVIGLVKKPIDVDDLLTKIRRGCSERIRRDEDSTLS